MLKNCEAVTITASLEGMRIVIDGGRCELHEYNFEENEWREIESSSWPILREQAQTWLTGWNTVDRFAALNHLLGPQTQ